MNMCWDFEWLTETIKDFSRFGRTNRFPKSWNKLKKDCCAWQVPNLGDLWRANCVKPVLKASHPQTPPPHCTTDPNMCPLNNLIKKHIEQSFATFYLSALLQHREVRLGESTANRYSTSPQPSEYDKSYLQNTTGDKIDKAGTTAPLI